MIEVPWKMVLDSPDGRRFIRYKNKSITVLAEVFVFDDQNILQHKVEMIEAWFAEKQMPYLGAIGEIAGRSYLLVVMEIDRIDPQPDTQKAVAKLAYSMRRLADWYRYNYLIPNIKKQAHDKQ